MRKKVYAGLALLLLTLQFLAIPFKVQAAPADLEWQTPAGPGGTMGSIQWLTRLTFRSPVSVIDSGTNTEYRMNEDIFGDGSTDYLNDGGDSNAWYLYVPVDSAKQVVPNPSGQCLGVIAVELDKDGGDMWLKAIQPQRTTDGSECAIGGVSARQGRVQGSIGDNEGARIYDIGKGGQEINGRDSRWRNLIAPFFWVNNETIRVFDSKKAEFKPLVGTQLDTIKNAWESVNDPDAPPENIRRGITLPNGTVQNWSFFASADCRDEVLAVYPNKQTVYIFADQRYIVDFDTDGFDNCAAGRGLSSGSTGIIDAVSIPSPIAYSENSTRTADQVDDADFAGSGTTTDPNNPAGTGEATPPVTCASSWRSALSWIMCPVIGLAEEMIDKVDDFLRNFLYVDIGRFDTDGGLKQAWNTIRLISTIIIVIIALVMIFSEAMGAGIMDTYSVKKLLPRFVIAVIVIQLSWDIMREIINIGNILGNGMQGLLLAPFEGLREQGLYGLLQVNEASGAAQGGLIVAALAGTVAAFGAIATVAIAVLFALIIAFVTLIVRYMVIILCILFAPIAIAMSVLPGTQKTSKLWWESFEKAVLMYPIIMALLASGKIVSYGLIQAGQTPSGPDGWFILAAIVAYFAPYALIPAALKAGGTALNKLTGAFNDKSKGVFDKAKGWQESRSKFRRGVKDQQRFERAGGKGIRAELAKASIRSRNGQSVSGLSIRSSRRDAMRKSMESLREKALEDTVKEADLVLQKSGNYGNANWLADRARTSTNAAERQAAINRIATLKDDKAMRSLVSDPGHAVDEISRADNKGTLAAAFSDKAPDLAKGKLAEPQQERNFSTFGNPNDPEPDKRVFKASAEKASNWSADTWQQALNTHPTGALNAAQAIRNDQKKWDMLPPEVQSLLENRGITGQTTPSIITAPTTGGTPLPPPTPPPPPPTTTGGTPLPPPTP